MRPVVSRAVLALADLHRALLAHVFAVAGPQAAYRFSAALARRLYRLLPPLRERCETQLRAALGDELSKRDVRRVAEQSFVHRIWNLTDLLLAPRYLRRRAALHRVGGRIPRSHLERLLAAQRRRQPAILLTGYYGPYDLLPVFLGFNGVQAAVVYRRHENPGFDRLRTRVRAAGGCELIPVEQALDRVPRVLESGGTVALLIDHAVEHGGLPVTFLGVPTTVSRAAGLLAARHKADVVVAGIRRLRERFEFEVVVSDVIDAAEHGRAADPVESVTLRYLRGLEALIRADPTQYLWAYERWKPPGPLRI